MSLVKRLALAYLAFTETGPKKGGDRAVRNIYEAARRYDTRRSWLPGWVRDARFDADAATRLEILRKSRYFERNNAIFNRLADLWEEYTTGPNGLRYVPDSSDPTWNKNMSDFLAAWGTKCDLNTLQNFGTCQSLSSRSWMVDGEVFVNKTHGKIRSDMQAFPRIQLIESHRVETPPEVFGDDTVVDGVQLDKREGRPVGYYVRQGVYADESYTYIEARDMEHIFEPTRVGMYRGLPVAYPVMNDLHDLDDLQMLNMDGAKDSAFSHNIIKTKTGEMSADDFRKARMRIPGHQGTSGGSSQDREAYYNDIFKGRIKVLRGSDDFSQHQVVRPSGSELALWDQLTSKICAGIGISKLLVFPWSMQGTVTRADLDVMSTFFRSRSSILAARWSGVYEYVAEWGTKNNRLLSDPPHDWRKHKVRAPRSVNVDVGRNASALIAEYEAGWRSLESICGELGEDWVEVLEQRGKERSKARDIEKTYGLEPGELIGAALKAIGQRVTTGNPNQDSGAIAA